MMDMESMKKKMDGSDLAMIAGEQAAFHKHDKGSSVQCNLLYFSKRISAKFFVFVYYLKDSLTRMRICAQNL